MSCSEKRLTNYLMAVEKAGVPASQLENCWSHGYWPQLKQLLFHGAARQCDFEGGPTEIAFGGARGPGKSHGLLAQIALDDCIRLEGCKALLLRRVGKAGKESFEDLRVKIFQFLRVQYNKTTGTTEYPSGSKIVLGHFKNEADIDNYLGLEYDVIGVEEATTLSLSKYKAIRTCCRSSKTGWRPRMYSNANPGGLGHSWYKERFVIPYRLGKETGTRFFPATFRDNAYIDAELYAEILGDLTSWRRAAWLEGDWDIAVGQYMKNFNHKVHCVPPVVMGSSWPKWLGIDTAWTHPTFVVLLTQSPSGDIFVVDEYYASQRLATEHSKRMHEMLGRHGLARHDLSAVYMGTDAWGKSREGKRVSDQYKKLGWKPRKAKMDRVAGAFQILSLLGDEDTPARLFICERCTKLLETLPRLEHDPHNSDDVLKCNVDSEGSGGDDAYDALRYAILSRPSGKGISQVKYIG